MVAAPDAQGDPMTPYARTLFALLAAVVLVEGFDVNLANVVLPLVGREFGAGPASLGRGLSIVALGAVAAFFAIRIADRVGRRPVLLVSVGAFSLLTLATAFAPDFRSFVALQFCARIALVTQITVAYVLIGETLPAAIRGRVVAMLAACGSLGAALPAFLLEPFIAAGWGWRGLFAIGATPVLVLPLIWKLVRESEVFESARLATGVREPTIREQFAQFLAPALRRRFAAASAMWFLVNFWAATAAFFFTYYVFQQRQWTPHDLQVVAPFALAGAVLGYVGSGLLMDALGRRRAAAALFVAGTIVTVTCYQSTSFLAIAVSWVAVQALQGVWPVAYVFTSELFPTHLRAAANGLTNNFLGRWGQVAAPALVGVGAEALGGIDRAVTMFAFVNLLALPIVLWGLPETRGTDLHDVRAS
jgi:putative MFS transporter